jgi:hypothetical protein
MKDGTVQWQGPAREEVLLWKQIAVAATRHLADVAEILSRNDYPVVASALLAFVAETEKRVAAHPLVPGKPIEPG